MQGFASMGKIAAICEVIAMIVILAPAFWGQEGANSSGWVVSRITSLEYPPLAAQARIDGTIEVVCSVSSDGAVRHAFTKTGNEILAKAARENAGKLLFRRADSLRQGASSERVLMKYTFRLGGSCAKSHCPTVFTFETPNLVIIETTIPTWQP
jgi:hypothetical protein